MRSLLFVLIAALFAVVIAAPGNSTNILGVWGGSCTQYLAQKETDQSWLCTDVAIEVPTVLGFTADNFTVQVSATENTNGTLNYTTSAQTITSDLGRTVYANGTVSVNLIETPPITPCYYLDITGNVMTVKAFLFTEGGFPSPVCPTQADLDSWDDTCNAQVAHITCTLTKGGAEPTPTGTPTAEPVTPTAGPVTPTAGPVTPTSTPPPVAPNPPFTPHSTVQCAALLISCAVDYAACVANLPTVTVAGQCNTCWAEQVNCLDDCFESDGAEHAACRALCPKAEYPLACGSGAVIKINWILLAIAFIILVKAGGY